MSQTTTKVDELRAKAEACHRETARIHAQTKEPYQWLTHCLSDKHGLPDVGGYLSAGGYAKKLVGLAEQAANAARAERDAWAAYHAAARAERDARPRRPTPCAVCGRDYSAGHCACSLSEPIDGTGPQGEDYMEARACMSEAQLELASELS